jgi:predicted transcriptional regulator
LISLYANIQQQVLLLPMNLSPAKFEILKAMLLFDKPVRVTLIANEVGKEFPSTMMHIIGLTRMGYTISPKKGEYSLTEKGKRALGIPEVNRENAKKILEPVSLDRSFHFYIDIGKPLDLYAQGLQEFSEKILKTSIDSVRFHKSRGDFEAWFTGLGDVELAKKVALLRERKIDEEELRQQLHDIVEERCRVLANVAGQIVTPRSTSLVA